MYSQDYRYIQYDANNGLAGSTVYCMLQDQQGFMWFGTETGISRFDGTHFKNFGTADGLPDNEIVEMFLDSKGRIWMAPFKKTVCYYYKGKIYNTENDSLLRKLQFNMHAVQFAEDEKGNILIMEHGQLHFIRGQETSLINTINGKPITICLSICKKSGGGFLVVEGDELYEFDGKHFQLKASLKFPYKNPKFVALNESFLVKRTEENWNTIMNLKNGTESRIRQSNTLIILKLVGDSLISINEQSGCNFYTLESAQVSGIFMKDKAVSRSYIDSEKNYWFATLGQGVFRLTSENMKLLELKSRHGRKLQTFSIDTSPGRWTIGADMMHIFELKYDSSFSVQADLIWDEFDQGLSSRVTAVQKLNEKKFILGSDMIIDIVPGRTKERHGIAKALIVKSFFRKSKDQLLVATGAGVFLVSLPDLRILDTLWKERATTVFYRRDTTYVGTLDGLFLVLKDNSRLFAGEKEPLFKNRISAIVESEDGMLWIATNGAGVLGYKNGRVEKRINTANGLSSDNCKAIAIRENEIWVGTNNGLNRIIDPAGTSKVIKFTVSDGLASNMVNAVGLDGKMVIVATPEGVNFFDADKISFESRCTLVIDDIVVSDQHMDPLFRSISLPHKDNNIKFEFAGISFRSGGEMNYEYRLIGLDTSWRITKENFLSYPTLPSGSYSMELRAVNKFGVKSNLTVIPFSVEELLTEKTWFKILLISILVFGISIFVAWMNRRVKRRELEKSEVTRRINELEQLALKSQMNPHFIFNCLNSIQQFVLNKDVAGSNRFISGFSKLIRQTLDISAKKEISLTEEKLYLSTYLGLERTRFANKFSFEIRNGLDINPDEFYIPPMMLQPFVENSIRHGIRYRPDDLGKILISFDKVNEELVCVVEDNGIGRAASLRFKSNNPIEYQSKGISLITSRVEFLNRHASRPITIQIEDMEDNKNISLGTRVVMKFPLENGINTINHD